MSVEGFTPQEVIESIRPEVPDKEINRSSQVEEESPTTSKLKASATSLLRDFEKRESSDNKELRFFASTADKLKQSAFDFIETDIRDKGLDLDEAFPDRRDVFRNLARVKTEAFGKIPYNELSDKERELYIDGVSNLAGVQYAGKYEGYYKFGFGVLGEWSREAEEAQELLHSAYLDKNKVLSDEELRRIYNTEKSIFKIHLNVPQERKIEVFKHLMQTMEEDSEISNTIMDEKEQRGEEVFALSAETKERGGKLTSIGLFKMLEVGLDEDHEYMADFVFYARNLKDLSAKESAVQIANELSAVLKDLNIEETGRIPRFSAPIEIDGEKITGLTYVQGNGDLKAHIFAKHDIDKLSEYYDPATNWALRKGEQITF